MGLVSRLRGYEIALGFFLATAVWAGLFLWQSQQAPSYNREQPSHAQAQHDPVGEARADTGAQKGDGDRHKGGHWYDTFFEHTAEWLIALFTGTLWYSTHRLWRAGERQFELALHSSAIAQSTLVASQRASDGGIVPESRARRLFAEARENRIAPSGFVLFPNQSYSREGFASGMNLSEDEFIRNSQNYMLLFVAACINYRFPTDFDTCHQTSCILHLYTDRGPVNPFEGTVPRERLRLREISVGADRADRAD